MVISEASAGVLAQLLAVLFVAAAVVIVDQRRDGLRLRGWNRLVAITTILSFAFTELLMVTLMLNGGASGVIAVLAVAAAGLYSFSALSVIWGAITSTGPRE